MKSNIQSVNEIEYDNDKTSGSQMKLSATSNILYANDKFSY